MLDDFLGDEIRDIEAALLNIGMQIRFGSDFSELERIIDTQPKRRKLHSTFDPARDLAKSPDAFWITGEGDDGSLIHSQAAQIISLGRGSLGDYLIDNYRDFRPVRPPIDFDSFQLSIGPKVSRLSGMCAYHGEFWVEERFRGNGTVTLLNRLGMYRAFQRWTPDIIFGLMSWALACDGFNSRIGYHHSEPMTMRWDRTDCEIPYQTWAVWMEREDFTFLCNQRATDFADVVSRGFGSFQ